jgi:uncharacterized protein YjeT (DUF2065 family)
MKFQIDIFLAAVGLAFIFESLPYFLAPDAVKRLMMRMIGTPPTSLRFVGLIGMAAGLALVAVSRHLG